MTQSGLEGHSKLFRDSSDKQTLKHAQAKTNTNRQRIFNFQLFLSKQRISVQSDICPSVCASVWVWLCAHYAWRKKFARRPRALIGCADWTCTAYKALVVCVDVFCTEVKLALELFSCSTAGCNTSSCFFGKSSGEYCTTTRDHKSLLSHLQHSQKLNWAHLMNIIA